MNCFSKQQTSISKGVALLLLIWHHLFYNSPEYYSYFVSVHSYKGIPVECYFADFCKVCVAIFLFLSGYGLFISYSKGIKGVRDKLSKRIEFNIGYVVKRLLRLLSDYWFIYIIFVPLGLLFGREFYLIYGQNPLAYLADIFGVSYLFYGYEATMNVTWWYMSIIIVYYIAFPILYRIEKLSGELLLLISGILMLIVPDYRELTIWILPYSFGIYFADRDIFSRLDRQLGGKPLLSFAVSGLAVVLFAYIRANYLGLLVDSLFAIAVILFTFFILSKIPVLNRILEQIGKYSGSIFMFHTFILGYYFKDFVYSFKYAALIFAVTVAICFVIAVLIEQIKKIIGYNRLVDFLCKKING
ncbi:MAG: acyltransferase family protein [Eubacterium sp.]